MANVIVRLRSTESSLFITSNPDIFQAARHTEHDKHPLHKYHFFFPRRQISLEREKGNGKLKTHTNICTQMLHHLQPVTPMGPSLTQLYQRNSISCLQADDKRTSRATYHTSSAQNTVAAQHSTAPRGESPSV